MVNGQSGNAELALSTAHAYLQEQFNDLDFSAGIGREVLTLPQFVALMAIAYTATSNLDQSNSTREWRKLTDSIINRLPDIRLTHHLASLYLRELSSGKHPTPTERRIDLAVFSSYTTSEDSSPLTLRPLNNSEPENFVLCVRPENTELAARLRSLSLPVIA